MKNPHLRGQTLVEAILLLPLVLLFVFGLLQACQIGVGLIVVNYGAASVARKAAQGGNLESAKSRAEPSYRSLMVGGLKAPTLNACQVSGGNDATSDIAIVARANVDAFPVVGPMLDTLASDFAKNSAVANWNVVCDKEGGRLPMISFSGSPSYTFTLNGVAYARRNYLQK